MWDEMSGNNNLEKLVPIYIERFRKNYNVLEKETGRDDLKGSEIQKWLKNEIQSVFSKDNIDSPDKQRAIKILSELYSTEDNGNPDGPESQKNIDLAEDLYGLDFIKNLKDLLFGNDEISVRYQRFREENDVTNSITSEIMSYFYPGKYAISNSFSEKALVFLGFGYGEVPDTIKNSGKKYTEYCENAALVLRELRKDPDFQNDDFVTLDYFLFEVSQAKIWKVAPGENAYLWKKGFYKKNEVISINWSELYEEFGNELLSANRDRIQETVEKTFNGNKKRANDYIINQHNIFLNNIVDGDIVVVNDGKAAFIGYGIVKSAPKYLYDEEEKLLCRNVLWQQTDLNIPIPKNKGLIEKCNKIIASLSFDQFRESILENITECRYWVMNPSFFNGSVISSLYFWNQWKEYGHIHLDQWKDFINKYGEDALSVSDYDEFKKWYNEAYDDKSQSSYLYKCLFSMKKGDIVIVNEGKSQIVGQGVIRSDTYYDDDPVLSYYHDVDWKKTGLNIPIPEDLKGKISKRVVELTKDEYERLMNGMAPDTENQNMAMLEKLLLRKKQVILYGPPGTGKTYVAKRYIDALSDDVYASELSGESGNIPNTRFVTFHPSFAYEDFIEGLRPESDDEGCIRYQVEDGVFKEFARDSFNVLLNRAGIDKVWVKGRDIPELTEDECSSALETVHDVPFYIIIDEINRGDISRIFGELITLLEGDKRLCAENSLTTMLPYSKTKFGIPPNLFIIGTMNTADKSIALVDIALRRRFGFLEMMPDSEILKELLVNENSEVQYIYDIAVAVHEMINNAILEKYDRDHQIGHSYFVKLKDDKTPEEACDSLEFIWYNEVLPLLQEYFYDSPKKLYEILGGDFVTLQSENRSFMFTKPCHNNAFLYALTKVAGIEDLSPDNESDEDYNNQDY